MIKFLCIVGMWVQLNAIHLDAVQHTPVEVCTPYEY
jgi:hypothetical protein